MSSMNSTPSGERVHIGFFGCRNAGKSSVVNAVTGQDIALVSDVAGTTTDPVSKAMELLPVGPVLIIDTPGIDDVGGLGEMRVQRTKRVLNKTDCAVLIADITKGLNESDRELIALFKEKGIPYVIAMNKNDLTADKTELPEGAIAVSAVTGENIFELKELIAAATKGRENPRRLAGDLVSEGDLVVLVVPIDSAAPKGRLILPQQMTIRDLLESGAIPVVCRETELAHTLSALGTKPKLVITDSQAFAKVAAIVPEDITLTSFSILMARYKGFLESAVKGAAAIGRLKDGDKVLISEGCTHHRQCGDIGTVKLPAWLKKRTSAELDLEFSSGTGFPEDLSKFALVIHCGGCMLGEREVTYRSKCAQDAGIPMTNYGTAIAYMNGILKRTLAPFPDLQALV
ncbi:[FeFe] hydrogenase H-cluster maturation GTPase HydF [Ruminococcus sp. YE71]|uniref:[FeFe] hydrogenase H-cluster maturation GTPase HydF n=1 Tax=unclassified Ruminococcus TaxID=2608920 RepID=UPI00088D925C|nr:MULTISPECIES: [FeFe] hydrogenase H-cluster maturation GTPase HydF [unclassified Ruminococcus]SDA14445.1 [FeFe] hydrogenase H-cluster maturation GTPase HydF [Ruminococcus sp. YE78]SFW21037.1 [FeFe] hydrogenase H-cluster maturation GTPase HydF [Ruminococcus sp. YE71]